MAKEKKPRRANGEGHIKQLPDGRWMAKKLVLRPDGEYQQVKAEAKTRGEAVARLNEKVAKLVGGAEATKAPAIREYAEQWYRDTFSPKARPSSLRTYRRLLDGQIIPYLGAMRIDRVKAAHLRTWLADLGRAGLSPKTLSMARSIVQQMLDQAVEDRLITHSPMTRRIRGPKIAKSAGRALLIEQALLLLDAIRGHRLELAIRLALSLGVRRAEVCGLRWQDVNLEAGTLTIAGQVVYEVGQGLSWVATTKTTKGHRTIRLPAVLVAAIRWHRERQRGERAAMGWDASPYLFTGVRSGGLLSPDVLYSTFKQIVRSLGLGEFRFHDLRHSAASFLLAQGVKLKKVQEILGHARGATTLDVYGHLLPGDDDDATERLADLLDPPMSPSDADDDDDDASGVAV